MKLSFIDPHFTEMANWLISDGTNIRYFIKLESDHDFSSCIEEMDKNYRDIFEHAQK